MIITCKVNKPGMEPKETFAYRCIGTRLVVRMDIYSSCLKAMYTDQMFISVNNAVLLLLITSYNLHLA